jgi:Tol biopolymer transport system component
MPEPASEDIFRDLEQDLEKLHHPLPLDAGFAAGLEEQLLAHAAKRSSQAKAKNALPRNRWITRISATSRALAWGLLALLLVAGLGWSIRHFLPGQEPAGGSAGVGIPTPTSPLVKGFIWQTDGSFGYRILRPSNWAPADMGQGRGYVEFKGAANQLELEVLNYQVAAQNMSGGILAEYGLFQQEPSFDGWTAGIEQLWQRLGYTFTLEETLPAAGEQPAATGGQRTPDQPAAKIYWVWKSGWDGIQLTALVVDQGQPLAVSLIAAGDDADAARLRGEGLLDDFVAIAKSLSAIPYDPANVDPPLGGTNPARPAATDRPAATGGQRTPDQPAATEQPDTTSASTEITGSLSLDTPHAEIRQRILNPTRDTLWLQGQASLFSSNAAQRNLYVQAWLERNGAGRVLSTDQIPGNWSFKLDMAPRWVWVSNGQQLSLFDLQTGQFDPSMANQRWLVHPLESAGQVMGMLFPTYLAARSEDLQVVEMSAQAGRPALVVDWTDFRLWVDVQSGVLLRQQTRDENGQVAQDVLLSAIAYNLPLPDGVLSTENLGQSRFEPPPEPASSLESAAPVEPLLSATPARLIFTAKTRQGTEIFSLSEGGSQPVQLTYDSDESVGAINTGPACSPDGRWIAFTGIRNGQSDIYLMRPDGSEETRLTDDPADDADPAFSPDGGQIAFVSQRDGNKGIYVMDLDGTILARLANLPANVSSPAWSPNGTQIAFTADVNGYSQIYLVNLGSSEQVNISNYPGSDYGPSWSPDGSKIAFYSASRVEGNQEVLYMVNKDGSGLAALTSEKPNQMERNMGPAWSPDGIWIAFYSYREGYLSGIFETPSDGSGKLGLQNALTPRSLEAVHPCWLPVNPPSPSAPSQASENGDNPVHTSSATIRSGASDPNGQVYLRSGPGTAFPVVSALPGGTQLHALGRTQAGDWIQVEYPQGSGQTAWVYSSLVDLSGGDLPVVEPPPTPTPSGPGS